MNVDELVDKLLDDYKKLKEVAAEMARAIHLKSIAATEEDEEMANIVLYEAGDKYDEYKKKK